MKRSILTIRKITFQTIIILSLLQILLGALWTLANLGTFQHFQETDELLEIAAALKTDEYAGVLYPLLVRAAQLLGRWFPLPYYSYLYLLQLGTGLAVLLKILERFPQRVWIALSIMTIPTVNQLYLAVLPQSLAASALLLCLHCCWKGKFSKGAVCWLLAGLLIPEYFWFCGGIFLIGAIAHGRKAREGRKRFWLECVLGLLAVCLLSGAVNGMTVERYSRGRMARTMEAAALRRFVWPHYADTYYFWPSEVKEIFSQEEMLDLRLPQYPDRQLYEFGPRLEKRYGLKAARKYYLAMAMATLRVRTREVLREIGADFLMYCVPPGALLCNLNGVGVSRSGWNYGRMAGGNWKLTRYYVGYACGGFWAVLILLLCHALLGALGEAAERKTLREAAEGEASEEGVERKVPGEAVERKTLVEAAERKASGKVVERKTLMEAAERKASEEGVERKFPGEERSVERRFEEERLGKPIPILPVGGLVLLSLCLAVWYTMSGAGMQDYKNVVPVSMSWGLLMAEVLFSRKAQD